MLDVLSNYVEATVATTLNNTDAAGTSRTVTVSAVAATWVNLGSGQQLRVMDKADLGATSGYEIMILTADNAGAAGTWTLTRGAEGSTVKAHTANWTLVPANTAGGIGAVAGLVNPPVVASGQWMEVPPTLGSGDSSTFVIGTLYAVRGIIPAGSGPIKNLGLGFNGVSTNPWLIGIYSDSGGYP